MMKDQIQQFRQIAKLDALICEKIGDLIPDNAVNSELLDLYAEVPDDIFLEGHDDDYESA
jgi:hypothetical protein